MEQSQPPGNCFISMGFYGEYDSNYNVVGNNSVRAAHTIWTRKTNVGTGSFPLDIDSTTYDQAFNNVFLVTSVKFGSERNLFICGNWLPN